MKERLQKNKGFTKKGRKNNSKELRRKHVRNVSRK